MPGLTDADLSFFDSHMASGKRSNPPPVSSSTDNQLLNLFFNNPAPSSPVAIPQPAPPVDNGNDDEFGSFEEFDEPLPSSQTQEIYKEDVQPNQLADKVDQPIRFGQHLKRTKDATGAPTLIKTTTSKKKWEAVQAAIPVQIKQTPAPVVKSPTKEPTATSDEWGMLEWENDEPEPEKDINYRVSQNSLELLKIAYERCLPVVEQLLTELAPVSYQLRKRILSHPKTKTFIKGYLEIVHITSRLIAGRRRRCSGELAAAVDREARHVERVWKGISARLGAVLPQQELYDLSVGSALPLAPSSVEQCMVCGLTRTEFVKGHPKPKWASHGHKSCLAWWNNLHL